MLFNAGVAIKRYLALPALDTGPSDAIHVPSSG
jgi:hypothetical protein